ncbi:CIS tube protein [Streptomyces liliifuscus]|uniref:Contractile injection system tube protein N-terminal domain-containing protein n=1 Tax=Streptomyces liliifuscus TaxID=2797636 RepID=A0A7T7RFD8_9ACTN|nr:hypothetical protein [Streptomyces liliifuscus]QQM44580.1 hypothetical protein JEQ17_37695 [Streptomyces liliifuscus]
MSLPALEQPKRGYLAQLLTIPPLIYPFQYNPAQISDSRRLNWSTDRTPNKEKGYFRGLTRQLELKGQRFSGSTLKSFKADAERTVSFRFVIDGRELRPGEPARRRDGSGSILGDLAVIRSFAYPQMVDVLKLASGVVDAFSAAAPTGPEPQDEIFFHEPPPLLLVFGSTTVDGVVSELRINETQFNADLDPVRAEVEISMTERVDSLSFMIDTARRIGLAFYDTAYEDIGNVLF